MKYVSKYTTKLVTPANHIVEILMERLAKKNRLTLTQEFWLDPAFKREYNLALIQVSKLLAAFSEEILLEALRRNEWAYSFHPIKSYLPKIQREFELKKITESQTTEVVKDSTNNTKPEERKSFKSSLGKLK